MNEPKLQQIDQEVSEMLAQLFKLYPEKYIDIPIAELPALMAYRHKKNYLEADLRTYLTSYCFECSSEGYRFYNKFYENQAD